MQYMILLYGDETAGGSPTEMSEEMAGEWVRFEAEMQASGRLVTWRALEPTASTRRLRITGEEAVITDGPFAETKEQLGGFYLLDCASAEEAMDCARRMPCASVGSVEVRPVFGGPAVAPESVASGAGVGDAV